jgi:hypothetical protein
VLGHADEDDLVVQEALVHADHRVGLEDDGRDLEVADLNAAGLGIAEPDDFALCPVVSASVPTLGAESFLGCPGGEAADDEALQAGEDEDDGDGDGGCDGHEQVPLGAVLADE